MAEFIAIFASGAFFGASLHITLVQQPAALETGSGFAGRFFAPMYRRASAVQAPLALIGTLGCLGAWWQRSGLVWLAAALLLFAVIPFTFLVIMPLNHRLLAHDRDPGSPESEALLRRWGSLHAVRTLLSGIAFAAALAGLASARP